MKKIDDKDLESISTLKSQMNNIVIELGEIQLNRLLLDKKEISIENKLEILQNQEKELKTKLINKYGDSINIDLNTGEYK